MKSDGCWPERINHERNKHTMSDKKTEPTELARQARLMLATTKAIQQVIEQVTAPELLPKTRDYDPDAIWVSAANRFIDEAIKAVVTTPGLRIAVFGDNEKEATDAK